MGSLAPGAADLTMRNLGHMARREQGWEPAPERKDAIKPWCIVEIGETYEVWSEEKLVIKHERLIVGETDACRDTCSSILLDIFLARKVLERFTYTVFSKLKKKKKAQLLNIVKPFV